MRQRCISKLIVVAIAAAVAWNAHAIAAELTASAKAQLQSSKYVYIASQRKTGDFGRPAEIWFLYHQGAIWVVTAPSSWRVRRIRAGRPEARIAVGKPDGPTFSATGSVVRNREVSDLVFDTFAKKYPDAWPKYERRFRDGIGDGSRVLVKYVPK
jgi:hypothetical protein